MVFDDLKEMEGQIIDYYEVNGTSITAKKGKINENRCYGNNTAIELKLVDELGRCHEHTYHTIFYGGRFITESNVYDCGYVKLYLDKEKAYNHVINNLRKQRREINRRMLKLQMELYGKKTEIKNEG